MDDEKRNKLIKRLRDSIHKEIEIFEKEVKRTGIIVVLLGAGGKGIEDRKNIARKLEDNGILALIPEIDFPPEVPSSLIEEYILERSDVDLVFLKVESWGSATEFGQFLKNVRIAPKLRILTFYEYHPLYGSSKGYLPDLYLTHMAKYGHVYAYDDSKKSGFPSSEEIILTLSIRYQYLKASEKLKSKKPKIKTYRK